MASSLYTWTDRFRSRLLDPIARLGRDSMPDAVISFQPMDHRILACYTLHRNAQGLLDEIKHQVEDEAQRERTHPAFVSLSEQWEQFTQQAQRLPRRCTLVQLPEREGVRRLRTVTVGDGDISGQALEDLKQDLAKRSGKPREAMERAIAQRGFRSEREEIEYYEPTEEAEAGREPLAMTGSPPV